MTPHRRAPRGPFWVVGAPSAQGYCSPPRALSPENAYPCPRGTGCSGALVTSPRTLSRALVHEPSGNRVLGGCHEQPRALSPEHFCIDLSGNREPEGCHAQPRALSPSILTLVLGEPCARGLLRAVPEHSLLELSSFDHRGTRVLGGDRAPPRALSLQA